MDDAISFVLGLITGALAAYVIIKYVLPHITKQMKAQATQHASSYTVSYNLFQ